MITIKDLTGIPKDKRKRAIECLDNLLTFKDNQGNLSSVITGYNFYNELPENDTMITFSHIHETEAYKKDMLDDLGKLGYDPQEVLEFIREKAGAFLWDLDFDFRDEKGNILPRIKIREIKGGLYIDLQKFAKPFVNYLQFKDSYLVAENQGWEIDLPFNNKRNLMNLVDLFLKKSGKYIYDEIGNKIKETDEEKQSRNVWVGAYETPVLLLGEIALKYAKELPHFIPATKIVLKENSNEISFIIHKNLEHLRNLKHYETLLNLGFKEEQCLGNKPFIIRYVDKKR